MSDIIAETARLIIRELEDVDEELIFRLSNESELLSVMHKDEKNLELYRKIIWEEANSPSIYNGMIFLKDNASFIGKICMQHTNLDAPELGITIIKSQQNNGYAPEAIAAFCNYYSIKHGLSEVNIRISEENTHSIYVFEKLGAVYTKSASFLSENSLAVLKRLLPDEDLTELYKNDIREYILNLPI